MGRLSNPLMGALLCRREVTKPYQLMCVQSSLSSRKPSPQPMPPRATHLWAFALGCSLCLEHLPFHAHLSPSLHIIQVLEGRDITCSERPSLTSLFTVIFPVLLQPLALFLVCLHSLHQNLVSWANLPRGLSPDKEGLRGYTVFDSSKKHP